MGMKSTDTPAAMFRRHIREMRDYADELAPVLGSESSIVRRIRNCADECSDALNNFTTKRGAGSA